MIEWIQTTAHLQKLLKRLQTETFKSHFLALDTEFIRRSTFYAKPCLLQIGWKFTSNEKNTQIETAVALIDMIELPPKQIRSFVLQLFQICTEHQMILAMHAPSEDFSLFDNLEIPRTFTSLFDTQLAAGFLGCKPQMSLFNLAKLLLNVDTPSSFAQSDWEARPLSWPQVSYAATDVLLVLDLCEILQDQLTAQQYWDQALEDGLCIYQKHPQQESTKTYSQAQQQIAKIEPVHRARLAHLMEWREGVVRFLDVPRKWHLTNDALVEIAVMGDEESPPKLQIILQRLFNAGSRKKTLTLHDQSKDLFLQTLDLDQFHDGFYAAWKTLPAYPTTQTPVRFSKKSKPILEALVGLATEYASAHQYAQFAFMKRSWLKLFMVYFAEKKLGYTPKELCIAQGFRAPFFQQVEQYLELHWPFHIPTH